MQINVHEKLPKMQIKVQINIRSSNVIMVYLLYSNSAWEGILGVLFQECIHALILNLVERHICRDKGLDYINTEDVVRAGAPVFMGVRVRSC